MRHPTSRTHFGGKRVFKTRKRNHQIPIRTRRKIPNITDLQQINKNSGD